MGTISRHAGAPFQDGETLAGADLEADFATIYSEFNGSISAANLAAGAVTAAKLASDAVVQASIVDKACSNSSAQTTDSTGLTLTTSFQTVGSAVTLAIGNPARHVVVMASFAVTGFTNSSTLRFQLLKDGVALLSIDDSHSNTATGPASVVLNRMYVDTAPTAGGSHIYTFQAKHTAANATLKNAAIFAFEPRR